MRAWGMMIFVHGPFVHGCQPLGVSFITHLITYQKNNHKNMNHVLHFVTWLWISSVPLFLHPFSVARVTNFHQKSFQSRVILMHEMNSSNESMADLESDVHEWPGIMTMYTVHNCLNSWHSPYQRMRIRQLPFLVVEEKASHWLYHQLQWCY